MLIHTNGDAGVDCANRDLDEVIARVKGIIGELVWDNTKPDGIPHKLVDVSR